MEKTVADPRQQPDGDALIKKDAYKELGIPRLPFATYLSFEPLLRRVERSTTKGCTEALLTEELFRRLEQAPQFRGPIEKPESLREQQDVLDLLLSLVLSPFTRETQLAKIAAPFDMNAIYYTPALHQLDQENELYYEIGQSREIMYTAFIVSACSLILNRFYGQDIKVDPPISLTVRDPRTGLIRHFKTKIDIQFVDIRREKPLLPISEQQIHRLLSNIYDVDLWLQYLPPANFSFHGFTVGQLIDITEEEAMSQLKYRLLSKEAIVDSFNVRDLEQLLRTYFRLPDLQMGITAIDYPLEHRAEHKYKIRFDFLADRHPSLLSESNRNSIYEKACRYKEVVLIEDLEAVEPKTSIEQDLLEAGLRSIIVAPLLNKKEQVIGLLEIGSPRPFELHSFIELKFKQVISLFSLAIERSREEIDNQIEAIIREQFTAVHPIVEWRFIEASYKLLEQRSNGQGQATIEPIVFDDVYALYGQADIVSSSELRNDAIKSDLTQNLNLADRVIRQCLDLLPFPLLQQLQLKMDRYRQELEHEFNSSDETRIVDLLHLELHPMLDHLATTQTDLAGHIASYFNQLDEELRIIYRRRKDYEESVARINNTIANFLDEQEKVTQAVTPHYFEKYKTDGVEYDVYVGPSLLRHGNFCMMDFRNLRLWQLLHMVEITRRVHDLKQELPVALDTAQLIFAYNAPLSIRFRMDEKQFDVDGAYNVRYQILKKRIDKATLEGSSERLTVAGKIAIVYLQEKDREEYLEYLDFLRHQGLITDEIEDLRLGRMQGVQGLRALRATVILDGEPVALPLSEKKVRPAGD